MSQGSAVAWVDSSTLDEVRRTVSRYIVAGVVKIAERVAEMSPDGRYLDTLHGFPVGTLHNLRVSRDTGAFASRLWR